MDNSLLGLGRKTDKASKLHHNLQIEIYKEDCRNFDIFLLGYCFSSIIYTIAWYYINYNDLPQDNFTSLVKSISIDSISIIIWLIGFILSTQSLFEYRLMKRHDMRKSSKRLLYYIILQILYFAFRCFMIAFDVYDVYKSKVEKLKFNIVIMICSILLLMLFGFICVSMYFYSQKLGLAEEIRSYDTSSNKHNAAYNKAQGVLDI
ncbi:hypothetical protein SteCoe_14229 [Stentor coeruleus]|uniref:Uncharacterized protein n=1 Tax=Stentor coeruleus TaxID=5963 RepID=A0A1R2C6S9_9CILI|nr:hypothetical protein SteCoe_14229 [Stentor coeruleus]